MSDRTVIRRETIHPVSQVSSGRAIVPATRRGFVRMMGLGGAALAVPGLFAACDDDNDDNPMDPLPNPVTGLSFDLRTDLGFLQLVQALEEVEAFFYTQVVASSGFSSFFNSGEREVFVDLRDAEIMHREVIRAGLGNQKVPDLRGSINMTTVNTMLSSKQSILSAAKAFEHTGVSGLNGSGKYLTDARNLLFAGKLASVEGRHAAALLDISPPSGQNANTAFAGDNVIDANGRDVKLEANEIIARVASFNVLMPGTLAANPISNMPTAAQGVPTPSFPPPANL